MPRDQWRFVPQDDELGHAIGWESGPSEEAALHIENEGDRDRDPIERRPTDKVDQRWRREHEPDLIEMLAEHDEY